MDAIKELTGDMWGLFLSLRSTVSIWDIIDILIVAFMIYRILTQMRRTNASSVIKGLVILLIVSVLSNLLHMNVLSFVLRQIMQLGLLVLVILFQPELRKVFEKIGTSRISTFFRRRDRLGYYDTVIDVVVSAVDSMARSKTGALIVFEREVGLNDFAVTGIKLDADMSSELIQSIFFGYSPLHDGALIIRDGRLLAAVCMLPLSSNIYLSRELGMRHRAAIGISERSDAVSVVVSEQTGSVSVAVDGTLNQHLSTDQLITFLRNELVREREVNDNKYTKRLKVLKP